MCGITSSKRPAEPESDAPTSKRRKLADGNQPPAKKFDSRRLAGVSNLQARAPTSSRPGPGAAASATMPRANLNKKRR